MTVRLADHSIRRFVAAGSLATLVAACAAGPSGTPRTPAAVAPTSAATSAASPAASSSLAPASTAVGVGDEWIASQSDAKIHLIRPDGSGDHAVFPNVPGGEQLHPDWSPDGKRISFSVDDGTRVIWAGDADGSNTSKLVECAAPCVWVDEAAWSPDGRSLVYHRMVSRAGVGVSTLEILDLATKTRGGRPDRTRRSGLLPAALVARWHPGGDRVRRMSGTASDSDVVGVALAVVDVTAAKPVASEITRASELTNSPDWSRVTDLIVFAQPSTPAGFDGPSDLVTIHRTVRGGRR